MNYTKVTLGILLVGALVFGVALMPANAVADNHESNQTNNSSVNAPPGLQIATVIQSTSADIQDAVDDNARERAYERADSNVSKAETLRDQAEDLNESASEVSSEYREAVREYKSGEITKEQFAQRIATLNTRARNIQQDVKKIRNISKTLPPQALASANFSNKSLSKAMTKTSISGSSGASVINELFLGNSRIKNLSFDGNAFGLSVAADASEGRAFRGFERMGDENESYGMNESEALSLALENLNNGNWSVEEIEAEEGNYEFELLQMRNNTTTEAEITVDTSARRVIKSEVSEDDESNGERGPPDFVSELRGPPEDVGPNSDNAENEESEESEEDEVRTVEGVAEEINIVQERIDAYSGEDTETVNEAQSDLDEARGLIKDARSLEEGEERQDLLEEASELAADTLEEIKEADEEAEEDNKEKRKTEKPTENTPTETPESTNTPTETPESTNTPTETEDTPNNGR